MGAAGGAGPTALIDLLGGGLRALLADDVPLVETYADGAAAPFAQAVMLSARQTAAPSARQAFANSTFVSMWPWVC